MVITIVSYAPTAKDKFLPPHQQTPSLLRAIAILQFLITRIVHPALLLQINQFIIKSTIPITVPVLFISTLPPDVPPPSILFLPTNQTTQICCSTSIKSLHQQQRDVMNITIKCRFPIPHMLAPSTIISANQSIAIAVPPNQSPKSTNKSTGANLLHQFLVLQLPPMYLHMLALP
jgi:hypothetical protein